MTATVAVEAPEPFHTADSLMLQATYRRLLDTEGAYTLNEDAVPDEVER